MKLNVFSSKGVKKQSVNMPSKLVEKENLALLAQANYIYQDSSHLGLARTKTRGEVKISKRKIYRQKGTGGARHGAASAPIFVGGGVTHGPKGVKKVLRFPKKMRQKALKAAINLKAKEGSLVVVDALKNLGKTREAKNLIDKISKSLGVEGKKVSFCFLLSNENSVTKRYLKNIKNVSVSYFNNTNLFEMLQSSIVVLDMDILKEKGKGNSSQNKVEGSKSKKTVKGRENKSKTKKTPKRTVRRTRKVK